MVKVIAATDVVGAYTEALKLRKARARAALTQVEAAKLCGVAERTFQRWESGEAPVRPIYVDRIAGVARRS